MLYKKSLLYKRETPENFNSEGVNTKDSISKIKDAAKDILESSKEKLNEAFSDENIDKVKQKANEFSEDAKEAFDVISEKGSEFASEAAEHIADFAEDAKEDIKQASKKVQDFFKNFTKK